MTFTAVAEPGSVFSGWQGDAAGLDDTCTINMNSAKTVAAMFQKMAISEVGMTVGFESAQHTGMQNGESAIIFYLTLRNNGAKQVRITLPTASYLNRHGEELDQKHWLTGLVIGAEGATIRVGTFRKTGLIFYKSQLSAIAKGERLYVTIEQAKPAQRLNYILQCTATSPDVFSLVHASAQAADAPADATPDETPADTQQLQQELAAVQLTLKTMQAELDAIKRELALLAQPAPRSGDTPASAAGEPMPSPAPPGHSLKAVVAWLAQHDRMTRPALRAQLLPLDLLPNSVMEEINEKALDLTGVLALEDVGDEIIVAQDILAEVLADWEQGL